MSFYDAQELSYYDIEAVDTIAAGSQRWDTYANLVANLTASARTARTGEDIISAGARAHKQTPEQNQQEALAIAQQGRLEDLDEQAGYLIANPSPASMALEGYNDARMDITAQAENLDNFADVASEESTYNLEEEVSARIKAQDKAALYASRRLSEVSGWDMAKNIGEQLFLPFLGSPAVDAVDVLKEAGIKDYGYFTSEDGLRQIRSNFIRLPPQEQEAAMQYWYQVFLEASDNNELVAGTFVEFLNSPEDRISLLIDKIIDVTGVATLAHSIGTVTRTLIKGSNAINRLAKTNRVDDAAVVTKAALDDESGQIAQRLGVTRTEAAATSQPIDMKDLLGEGVPNEVALEVKRMEEATAYANAERLNAQLLLEETAIQDRISAIRRQPEVSEVQFIPASIEGPARIAVTEVSGPDGAPFTKIFDLQQSAFLGELQTKSVSGIGNYVMAPASKYVEDVRSLVSDPTFGQQQVARIKDQYTKLLKEYKTSFRKLSNDEKTKVNALLREGDKSRKEYKYQQLKHDFGLSDNAAVTYFKNRQLSRNAWNIKSRDMLEQARREGFTVHAAGNPARIIEKGENPKGWMSSIEGNYVWDVVNRKRISKVDLEEKWFEDYELVRFRGPKIMASDKRGTRAFTHAIVPKDNIRDLTNGDMLEFRRGYVPKLHENAKYFVSREMIGTVNGAPGRLLGHKVEQAFSDKKKAQEYFDSLTDEQKKGVTIRYDREYDQITKHEEMRDFNGPFTGARKTEPLKIDGVPDSDLVDPMSATAEYYNHLASRGVLDPLRQELQQRWLNTYKNNIDEAFVGSFKDAVDKLKGLTPKQEVAAKSTHDHISMILGMKSEAETARQRYVRELFEVNPWLNRRFAANDMFGDFLRDPTGVARAATFHLQLGMLNLAQLPVQASGLLVSFGAHPIAFTKMLPQMQLAMLADSMPIRSAKIAGLNQDAYRLWRKSGFAQTIDMNADIADALATNDVAKVTSIFFRMGEYMNRNGAFFTAYDVVRAKKGVSKLTDADLADVSDQANRLMLNFSTVNKSKWQDGVAGVVMQFAQVMEKSLNQIYRPLLTGFKSPLTKAEQAGAAATQMIMFGTLGIPMGAFLWKQVDGLLAEQGATPDEAEIFKRGLISQMTGQMDVGSRIAIGQTVMTFWLKLFTGDLSLQAGGITELLRKGALGPSGTNMARAIDVANTFMTLKDTGNTELWLSKTAQAIMKMPATTRNAAMLVWFQETNELMSARGRVYDVTATLNAFEQAALGMGFSTKEIADMFEAQDILNTRRKAIEDVATVIAGLSDELMVLDPNQWNNPDAEIFGLVSMFDDIERMEIRERVQKLLLKKPYNEKLGNDLIHSSGILDPTTNRFIEESMNGTIQR